MTAREKDEKRKKDVGKPRLMRQKDVDLRSCVSKKKKGVADWKNSEMLLKVAKLSHARSLPISCTTLKCRKESKSLSSYSRMLSGQR